MNSMTRIISRALLASLLNIAACSDSGDGVLYNGDLLGASQTAHQRPNHHPEMASR